MDWGLVLNYVGAIFTVGLTVAAIVGVIFGVKAYVERLVDKRLDSPETIDRLSKLIRPTVIFDNKGTILADLGAMEYIESIGVSGNEEQPLLPIRIELKCNKFLDLPPMLTSMDNYSYGEKVSRKDKFGWIFELEPMSYDTQDATFRFRLEVLR